MNNAPEWVSAISTLVAAAIALWIGVKSLRQTQRITEEQAREQTLLRRLELARNFYEADEHYLLTRTSPSCVAHLSRANAFRVLLEAEGATFTKNDNGDYREQIKDYITQHSQELKVLRDLTAK